jgi:hypothetical protein
MYTLRSYPKWKTWRTGRKIFINTVAPKFRDMTILLDKLLSANMLRKTQWTVSGKDDVNKLRSSPESHKSALEIALDIISL